MNFVLCEIDFNDARAQLQRSRTPAFRSKALRTLPLLPAASLPPAANNFHPNVHAS